MQKKSLTNTYIILLIVPLFWGGAFGSTKHVLTELPPLTASALRFMIAGVLLMLWSGYRKELKWEPIQQNFFTLLSLGATGVFFYNYFFATGLQYTSAINGALVVVVNPVFTALIACLFMGEARSWRIVLGVCLSLIGVSLVVSKGDLTFLTHLSVGVGEQYLFGAVASWVAYTLIIKKATRNMGASLVTAVSTILGAVMLLVVSVFSEAAWDKTLSLSTQVTWEIIYLAVFATVVAFLVFNWGIQRIGATKTSAYINLMPVNALWIAVLFYGESISAYHLIGMALTIAGVFITTQSNSKTVTVKANNLCDAKN